MSQIKTILDRLEKVKETGEGAHKACCPAHDDSDPSLAVTEIPDGRILIHCYAGCDIGNILAVLGLTLSDLFPDGAIQDRLIGATPWLRNQRRAEEKTLETERLVLDIGEADRAKGKPQSRADMDRELEAFMYVKEHGGQG